MPANTFKYGAPDMQKKYFFLYYVQTKLLISSNKLCSNKLAIVCTYSKIFFACPLSGFVLRIYLLNQLTAKKLITSHIA